MSYVDNLKVRTDMDYTQYYEMVKKLSIILEAICRNKGLKETKKEIAKDLEQLECIDKFGDYITNHDCVIGVKFIYKHSDQEHFDGMNQYLAHPTNYNPEYLSMLMLEKNKPLTLHFNVFKKDVVTWSESEIKRVLKYLKSYSIY